MLRTVKALCELNGTSGREENVREFILGKIDGKCEYRVDPLGNIIAFKKGKKRGKNKVMLTAHMDEVGFIITYITEDGFLRFDTVGGIDEKVIAGRAVTVGEQNVPGVIGLKPIHLTDKAEAGNVPSVSKLYIDIGASDKAEAEKYVSVGDSAYFISPFEEFGDSRIKAKALDDRFGCAVMLDMIQSETEYDAFFVFLVQEEVGLRGSVAAAYSVDPDYAIVLEATTAADVAGVSEEDCVCSLSKGAVISFMDRSTIYDRRLFKRAFELARENGVSCQVKTAVAGGNDAGSIHKSRGGVYTLTVSLPCRYIHSATSVADKRDMNACRQLAGLLLSDFADAETL